MNFLTNQISRSRKIAGVNLVGGIEVRISQYADDTVLFLDSTPDSVRGSLQELQTFSEMSGLKLNVEKTSCMMFGADGWCTTDNNFGLRWVHDMKVLGVVFTEDLKNVTEINIRPRLMQIEKEIVQWRRRHLTPFGKIAVIKSLLISKLVHLLAALPNPTAKTRKEIEKMFYNFIWGSKRDTIKRTRLTQDYAKGGLRMIDLNAFVDSLTLFLSGFFNANSVRGGRFGPPLRSRKLRSVETFCKRHWIGCDVISNFCKGHFQVRSILRSPEVTKGQISRKCLFFRKHSLLSPKV